MATKVTRIKHVFCHRHMPVMLLVSKQGPPALDTEVRTWCQRCLAEAFRRDFGHG